MDQEKEHQGAIDLSGALKESGAKDNDELKESVQSFYPGTPRIVRWVMMGSGGLIRNEKQATMALLVLFIIVLFTSGFLFLRSGTYVRRKGAGPSEEELQKYRAIQPF